MTQKERLEIIRDLLSARPFVSLGELEKMFPEVTSMTLRRDIDRLETKGELIKVRGGARSMKFLTTSAEDDFGKRLYEATEEKTRIAECATEFVETGRSIFIDSGTTALRLASMVADERFTDGTARCNRACEKAKADSKPRRRNDKSRKSFRFGYAGTEIHRRNKYRHGVCRAVRLFP